MKNGKPKIEKGIPIPLALNGGGRGHSELLRQLKVGESVLLPCTNQSAWSLIYQIRRGKRKPCAAEFTGRKVDSEHTRVWRTK